MPLSAETHITNFPVAYPRRTALSFKKIANLAEDFFMGEGAVYETMRRLAIRLEQENIPYAVIGGMALAAHGYVRLTMDVDILLTVEGLQHFRERLVGQGYIPAFQGAKKAFIDTASKTRIEIITTGEFPGDGLPKSVAFPDPKKLTFEQDAVRFIKLEKLIELKLASGMTAPHRLRDLADVQDLIIALDLPLELMDELDESVQSEYKCLWETAQTGKGSE